MLKPKFPRELLWAIVVSLGVISAVQWIELSTYRGTQSHQKGEHIPEIVILGIKPGEWLLSIVTLMLWGATVRLVKGGERAAEQQSADMRASLDIASRSADAAIAANQLSTSMFASEHRPWLTIDRVEIIHPVAVDREKQSYKYEFRVTVSNVGKSPASRAHVYIFNVPLLTPIGPAFTNFLAGVLPVDITKYPIGITVFPGASVHLNNAVVAVLQDRGPTAPAQISSMMMGVVDYYFEGAGTRHQTCFRFGASVIDGTMRPIFDRDAIFPGEILISSLGTEYAI